MESNKSVTTEDSETLLVLDKQNKKVDVVSHIDPDGSMKTVPAKKKNSSQFIRIDRSGDLFSNFFSNFMNQVNNPSRFSFFIVSKQVALEMAETLAKVMDKGAKLMPLHEIRIPSQITQQSINQKTMETSEKNQQTSEYRYAPEQVNWETLAGMGLNKERLEKMNLLEPLLKGFKTNELVPLKLTLGDAVVHMDARLSLQPNDHGQIVVAMHGIRKEPNLNYAFFGHEFSPEDKENLLRTGNMGRVVELYSQKGAEYIPSIISVDRMTNELVALRSEWIKIPDEIKGVQLNETQKQNLMEGKAEYIENMISKKGEPFNATVQFNADKRYVEFLFDKTTSQRQEQSTVQGQQTEAPRTVRGKELDTKQYDKFKEGQTIHVSGFIDKQGKEYQGYITFNKETGQTGFSFQNPEKLKEKAQPTEAHKTQRAVNSEGKTNETTKNSKEPLKSAQQEPADKKQQEEQQTSTKKGRKI